MRRELKQIRSRGRKDSHQPTPHPHFKKRRIERKRNPVRKSAPIKRSVAARQSVAAPEKSVQSDDPKIQQVLN